MNLGESHLIGSSILVSDLTGELFNCLLYEKLC